MIVTRTIRAPRTLVFEAWTTPEHIGAWRGPDGFTTTQPRRHGLPELHQV